MSSRKVFLVINLVFALSCITCFLVSFYVELHQIKAAKLNSFYLAVILINILIVSIVIYSANDKESN